MLLAAHPLQRAVAAAATALLLLASLLHDVPGGNSSLLRPAVSLWAASAAAGIPLRAEGCIGVCAMVRSCVSNQAALIGAGEYEHARKSPRLARARQLAVAFPLHEPLFFFALDTIKRRYSIQNTTAAAYRWDIFFIILGTQANAFEDYVRAKAPELVPFYSLLILPESLRIDHIDVDAKAIFERNSPDTMHLFSLATLHPCYERLIVMDADVDIVRPNRLLAAAQQRLSSGRVFGMRSPMMRGYMSDPSTLCASEFDVPKLRAMTLDFSIFPWLDLPSINARDVPDFLQYINYPRTSCRLLAYESACLLSPRFEDLCRLLIFAQP